MVQIKILTGKPLSAATLEQLEAARVQAIENGIALKLEIDVHDGPVCDHVSVILDEGTLDTLLPQLNQAISMASSMAMFF